MNCRAASGKAARVALLDLGEQAMLARLVIRDGITAERSLAMHRRGKLPCGGQGERRADLRLALRLAPRQIDRAQHHLADASRRSRGIASSRIGDRKAR